MGEGAGSPDWRDLEENVKALVSCNVEKYTSRRKASQRKTLKCWTKYNKHLFERVAKEQETKENPKK